MVDYSETSICQLVWMIPTLVMVGFQPSPVPLRGAEHEKLPIIWNSSNESREVQGEVMSEDDVIIEDGDAGMFFLDGI